MRLFIAYLAGLLAFFLIDIVWITLVVVDAYHTALGPLIIEDPRLVPAVAFYLLYVGGLVLLAARPALREGSAKLALGNGALVGLFGYGTYALTNYAMFKDWTWHLVWTDMLWGMLISSTVSLVVYLVARPRAA
jgi:uncharacterized membrane protein